MKNIRILDCTLRDGGYLNSWNFGSDYIRGLISSLSNSYIDIIECGFLTDNAGNDFERSLYQSTDDLVKYLPENSNSKFALMVNLGEYDLSKINSDEFEIRIAFKQYDIDKLSDYLIPLIDKRVPFSLNPMHISLYSRKDLISLIKLANDFCPVSFTAVDTMGIMTQSDVKNVFSVIDDNLSECIDVGFHSHNNLGLSFDNVKELFKMNLNRNIVIDSCLSGIGRGGGMLSTEDIAIYLNDTYSSFYKLSIEDYLLNYLKLLNTDNGEPYYLSAKYKCHPNYAKYLYESGVSLYDMEKVFSSIPEEFKPYYNKTVIKEILDKKNSLVIKEV